MEQFIPQSSLQRALNHTLISFYLFIHAFIYFWQKIWKSVDFTQRLRIKGTQLLWTLFPTFDRSLCILSYLKYSSNVAASVRICFLVLTRESNTKTQKPPQIYLFLAVLLSCDHLDRLHSPQPFWFNHITDWDIHLCFANTGFVIVTH